MCQECEFELTIIRMDKEIAALKFIVNEMREKYKYNEKKGKNGANVKNRESSKIDE